MLYLNEEFQKLCLGKDPFTYLPAIDGAVFRKINGRCTKKIVINNRGYFIKSHSGVGWKEIFKNLLQLRAPILSAANEWLAINRLQELGVKTLTTVAFGRKGVNPAAIDSFIVTEELANTVSLEEFCADWSTQRPKPALKWALIRQVAQISRRLHDNGVCHRDFYICHFLLHKNSLASQAGPELSLIDLHRALVKKNLSRRWIIKDVAGLLFSTKEIGLCRRDLFRFMRSYRAANLRSTLLQDRQFWDDVNTKAREVFQREAAGR